jgi:hypothetical protein
MECFGTTDFDNNSRLITLSAIIITVYGIIFLDNRWSEPCEVLINLISAVVPWENQMNVVQTDLFLQTHISHVSQSSGNRQSCVKRELVSWTDTHGTCIVEDTAYRDNTYAAVVPMADGGEVISSLLWYPNRVWWCSGALVRYQV